MCLTWGQAAPQRDSVSPSGKVRQDSPRAQLPASLPAIPGTQNPLCSPCAGPPGGSVRPPQATRLCPFLCSSPRLLVWPLPHCPSAVPPPSMHCHLSTFWSPKTTPNLTQPASPPAQPHRPRAPTTKHSPHLSGCRSPAQILEAGAPPPPHPPDPLFPKVTSGGLTWSAVTPGASPLPGLLPLSPPHRPGPQPPSCVAKPSTPSPEPHGALSHLLLHLGEHGGPRALRPHRHDRRAWTWRAPFRTPLSRVCAPEALRSLLGDFDLKAQEQSDSGFLSISKLLPHVRAAASRVPSSPHPSSHRRRQVSSSHV